MLKRRIDHSRHQPVSASGYYDEVIDGQDDHCEVTARLPRRTGKKPLTRPS